MTLDHIIHWAMNKSKPKQVAELTIKYCKHTNKRTYQISDPIKDQHEQLSI